MNTKRAEDYYSHAEFCSRQSQLAEDSKVKKYWDDLASGWLILEDMELQPDALAKINTNAPNSSSARVRFRLAPPLF